MLNFNLIAQTPVHTEYFPYMSVGNVLDQTSLDQVAVDFPPIEKPGIFPLQELTYGEHFKQLLEDIQSKDLEDIMQEKFQVDLSDKPLMVTVRGFCQGKDGRAHTDSKDKVVTCLLYLNEPKWPNITGRLRLLRDGRSLENVIAEIPPDGGNLVAFKRTNNSWHGHQPFVGPRRYIMFNWVRSEFAKVKNVGRHRMSAVFKRLGVFDGY